LRHEIFLFSLQLSATLINLAQNRQILYDNCWAIRLIGALLLTDFHVSRTASPVATGGFGMLSPPNNAPSPPKLKYENYILVEFCQFLQCQGINRETKNSL